MSHSKSLPLNHGERNMLYRLLQLEAQRARIEEKLMLCNKSVYIDALTTKLLRKRARVSKQLLQKLTVLMMEKEDH